MLILLCQVHFQPRFGVFTNWNIQAKELVKTQSPDEDIKYDKVGLIGVFKENAKTHHATLKRKSSASKVIFACSNLFSRQQFVFDDW